MKIGRERYINVQNELERVIDMKVERERERQK